MKPIIPHLSFSLFFYIDVGNLAGLRTFRVLRALKTISIMPGLKTIINALLHSFKQLAEVMTLTIFCLMVFALFALQVRQFRMIKLVFIAMLTTVLCLKVYMGELRNKCVLNHPEPWINVTVEPRKILISLSIKILIFQQYEEWYEWISNTSNWRIDWNDEDEEPPMLCGNLTGARHCPPTHTCLRVGDNPNHGYTNFDNFMWSMLTTFQLITLDYWENVYNMVR
jgi:voltage-gated cation channel